MPKKYNPQQVLHLGTLREFFFFLSAFHSTKLFLFSFVGGLLLSFLADNSDYRMLLSGAQNLKGNKFMIEKAHTVPTIVGTFWWIKPLSKAETKENSMYMQLQPFSSHKPDTTSIRLSVRLMCCSHTSNKYSLFSSCRFIFFILVLYFRTQHPREQSRTGCKQSTEGYLKHQNQVGNERKRWKARLFLVCLLENLCSVCPTDIPSTKGSQQK